MKPRLGEILKLITDHLSSFSPAGRLQSLEGGNLNHVWRLPGEEQNLVIKYAPPYIASDPEVPLSSKRIEFEARALKLFRDPNMLHKLASKKIRPPEYLHFDSQSSLLIMEDVGNLPDLQQWLTGNNDTSVIGNRLGRFIGTLHRSTFRSKELQDRFDNKDIQQTRNQIQYQPAADYAKKNINLIESEFRSEIESLGKQLLEPGRCLIMGDLWPPSLLLGGRDMRIIDWEFVHYGRPLQDVGHWAAHCWMQAHTGSSGKHAQEWRHIWESFWEAYKKATGELFAELFDEQELNLITSHIGAEILIRAAGPFKEGYVYQGFHSDHAIINEAVNCAVMITESKLSDLWEMPES